MQTSYERNRYADLATGNVATVYRTARRIVGNDADAADVTQETFLAILKHPRPYLEGRDPAGSLRWLANKKALEHLRRKRTRSRKEIDPMNRANEDESPLVENFAATRETHHALNSHLARLPDELRIPVILRFQNGLTFGEIAELTDVAEPSAHDRVRRGLDKLRALLTASGFGALALSIESELSAAEPPAIPAGLETKVLTLGAAKASSMGMLTTALGALLLTSTVLLWQRTEPFSRVSEDDPNGESLAALVDPAEVRETWATDPQSPSPPAPPPSSTRERATSAPTPVAPIARESSTLHATVEGTVRLLADDRAMLPEFRVSFFSVRDQEKGSRKIHEAAIGADGKYRIELPVYPEGSWFRAWLEYSDSTMTESQEFELKVGETLSNLDFAFSKSLGERHGSGEVEILARDGQGNPVADLWLNLERRFEYLGNEARTLHEGRSRTDANGRARFATALLGTKRVRAFREKRADPSAEIDFSFDGQTGREVVITLPPEDLIQGRIVRADGMLTPAEIEGITLRAIPFTDTSGSWRDLSRDLAQLPHDAISQARSGRALTDGRFSFRGLPLDDYLITVESGGAIRAHATRRPGTSEFEIRVSQLDDSNARRIGGRVIDGVSGQPIAKMVHDDWLVTIPDGMSEEDVIRDLLPNETRPRVYQVAVGLDSRPTERFTYPIDHPGRYAVVYLAGEHAPAYVGPFDLSAPAVIENADLRLLPTASVSGRVVDRNGDPVSGAWILVTGSGPISDQRIAQCEAQRVRKGSEFHPGIDAEAMSDAQGRFQLKGLGGILPVRIVAVHPSFSSASSPARTFEPGASSSDLEIVFSASR